MSKKFKKRVQRNRGSINVVEAIDEVAIVEAVKEVRQLETMFTKTNKQVMNFDKGIYGVNTKLAEFSDTLKEMDKLDTFDIKDLKEYSKYINSLRSEIESSKTKLLDLNTSKNKIAENYYVQYMGYLKDIRKAETEGGVNSQTLIDGTRRKMKTLKQEHNETLEAINKQITGTNNVIKQSESVMKNVKTTSHGIFSPAHMGLNKGTKGLKSFAGTLSQIGATYATLQAGMYMYKLALGRSIEKFEELEDKVFELGVVSGKTTTQIKALRTALLDQASTSRYSAGEISDSLTSVIRTGKEYDEAMKIVKSSTDLATASFADLGYATETVNKTMVSFGMGADNAGKVVGAFHNIVLSTPLDLEQLNDSLRQSASGFGAIINFSTKAGGNLEEYKVKVMETMSVMTGLQALMGRSGSQAGTTLKMFSSKLLALTPAAKKQFNEQMKAAGEDFSAGKLSNLVKSDLDGAINKLSELYTAGTLSYEVLMKMFGTRHVSQISNSLSMIGGNLESTKDQFLKLRDVTDDADQAQESWSNSIKELRNSMTGLEGSFVSFLDGPAKDIIDFMAIGAKGMASMDSALGGIPSTMAGITTAMGPIALIFSKLSEFGISKAISKDAYNVGGLVELTGVLDKAGDFMGANKDIQRSLFLESKKRAKELLKLKSKGVALDANQLKMYELLISKEAGYHKLVSKRSKMMDALTSTITSPAFLITAALVAGTTAFYAYKRHLDAIRDELKSTKKEISSMTMKSEMFESKMMSGSVQIIKALSTQTDSWYDLSDGIMYASRSLGEFFSTDIGSINAKSIGDFKVDPTDTAKFKDYLYGNEKEGKTGVISRGDYSNESELNALIEKELRDLDNLGAGFTKESFKTIEEFVKGGKDGRKNIELTMGEYKRIFGEDLSGKSAQEIAGFGGKRLNEEGKIVIDGFKQLNKVIEPLRDKLEISTALRSDESEALLSTVESMSKFQSSIKSFSNELKNQEKSLLRSKLGEAKTYEDFLESVSTPKERKAFTDAGLIGGNREEAELMFYRKERIKKYGEAGVADVNVAGSLLEGLGEGDMSMLPDEIINLFDKQGGLKKGVSMFDLNEILSDQNFGEARANISKQIESISVDENFSEIFQKAKSREKGRMIESGYSKDMSESELDSEAQKRASEWAVNKYGAGNTQGMVDKIIRKSQLMQMEILLKSLDVAGANISMVFEDRLVQFDKAISTVGMKDLEDQIRRADFFGDTKGYYEKVQQLNDMKYENELEEIDKASERIAREAKVSYGGIADKSKALKELSIDSIGDMTVAQLEQMRSVIEAESVKGSDGTMRIKEGYQKLYVDIGNAILNQERKTALEAVRKTEKDIRDAEKFMRDTGVSKRVLGFSDIYGTDSSVKANRAKSAFKDLQIANKGVIRDKDKNELNFSQVASMMSKDDLSTREGLDALSAEMFGVGFGDLAEPVQEAMKKLAIELHDSGEQVNKAIISMAEGMYNFTTGLYKSLRGGKGFSFSGAGASKDMFAGFEKMLNSKRGSKDFNSGLQDAMVNMSLLVADFSNMKFADMIQEQRDNLETEESLLNRQIRLAETEHDRIMAQTKLANAQASAMMKIAGIEGKQTASENMLGMLKQGYKGAKWLSSDEGTAAIGKVKGWFGGGDTAGATTGATTGGTTTAGATSAMSTAGAVGGGVMGGVGIGMSLSDGFQMSDAPAVATGAYGAYAGGTALASSAGMGAMAGLAAAGALAGVGIIVGMAVMDQMGKQAVADAAKKANKELKEYESKQYEEQMIDILKEQSGILKGIKDDGLNVGFGEAFGRQLQNTQLSATSTELFKAKYIDGGWFGSGTWAREAVSATVSIADFGFSTARSIEDVYTLLGATYGRMSELQGLTGSRGADSGGYSQKRQWALWQAELEATGMLFNELRDLQKSYVSSLDDLYTQYFGFETVALNKRGEIAKEGEVVAEYQTSFWKDRENILKAISDDFINGASNVGDAIASSFVNGISSAISKNDMGLNEALSGLEDAFLNLSHTYIDSASLKRAADFELSAGPNTDVGMLKNILSQYESAGYGTEELFKAGYAEADRQSPDIQNLYDIIMEVSSIEGSRESQIKDLAESLAKVEEESSRLDETMQKMTEEWVEMGGKLSDLTSALNNRLKGIVDITGGALGKDSGSAIGELKGFFETYLLPQVKDSMVDSVQNIILDINKTTSTAIEKVMSGDMSASEMSSMISEVSNLTDMLADPAMYENELRSLGIQDDQVDTMIQYLELQEAISEAVFDRMTFDEQISKLQKDITDQAGKYKKIMSEGGDDTGLAGRQLKTLEELNEYILRLEDTSKLSTKATRDFTNQWLSGAIEGLFETVEGELDGLSVGLFQAMQGSFSTSDYAQLGTSIGSSVIKGITDSYSSNLMNNTFKGLFADINTIAFKALDEIDDGKMSMDTIHELSQQVQSASVQMEGERQRVEAALSMFDYDKEITYDKLEKEISYSTSSTKESVYNISNYNTFEVGNLVSTSADLEYFAQIFAPYMQQAFRDIGVGNK